MLNSTIFRCQRFNIGLIQAARSGDFRTYIDSIIAPSRPVNSGRRRSDTRRRVNRRRFRHGRLSWSVISRASSSPRRRSPSSSRQRTATRSSRGSHGPASKAACAAPPARTINSAPVMGTGANSFTPRRDGRTRVTRTLAADLRRISNRNAAARICAVSRSSHLGECHNGHYLTIWDTLSTMEGGRLMESTCPLTARHFPVVSRCHRIR